MTPRQAHARTASRAPLRNATVVLSRKPRVASKVRHVRARVDGLREPERARERLGADGRSGGGGLAQVVERGDSSGPDADRVHGRVSGERVQGRAGVRQVPRVDPRGDHPGTRAHERRPVDLVRPLRLVAERRGDGGPLHRRLRAARRRAEGWGASAVVSKSERTS